MGIADFQVALAPVRLALLWEGSVLWAVPQLMLLVKVDTQYKCLVQIRYDIKLVLN